MAVEPVAPIVVRKPAIVGLALDTFGGPGHRLAEDALELGRRLRPGGEHLEPQAVVGDDGHAVLGPESREVGGELLENEIAVARQGIEVVDEDQIAGPDRCARRELRHPGDHHRLVRRSFDRIASPDLGEVLDRDLGAVDFECKIAGLETGDRQPLLVGHHDLDVDHPHFDGLAEDRSGRAFGRARRLRPDDRGDEGECGENCGTEADWRAVHSAVSFERRSHRASEGGE